MTTNPPRILPENLAYEVESFVDHVVDETSDGENTAFCAHRLAAAVYAAGFEAGERSADVRFRGADRRRRDLEAMNRKAAG